MLRWARNHSRKDPAALIDAMFAAPGQQTVTVAGTDAVELVIPPVAAQIKELKHQRTTPATMLLTIGDASSFRTSGHLAVYAGIGLARRRRDVIFAML